MYIQNTFDTVLHIWHSYTGYTAVLLVCIRTLLTLPFLDGVGELPLNPGFWIPSPLLPVRGFLSEDLNGLLVIDPTVDPFELNVVESVAMLPLWTYGFPLASVIDTAPAKSLSHYY